MPNDLGTIVSGNVTLPTTRRPASASRFPPHAAPPRLRRRHASHHAQRLVACSLRVA
ncbi:hypothetical protein [Brevibacterium sp. FAM 24630]|uniref:hypothetical protein n=1 Tax=unclassified Brevibacterium TaxID=2614124 RepID=UPI003C7BBAB3